MGKKIKELRRAKGLSQEALADKINVNFRTIQRIETGKNTPSIETLVKIADALNIETESFFKTDYLKSREEIISSIINILNDMNDEKLREFYKLIYNIQN